MSTIYQVGNGNYSKYEPRELVDLILNTQNKNRVAIFDLDGTIHKGIWPERFSGVTNADLAFYLTYEILIKNIFTRKTLIEQFSKFHSNLKHLLYINREVEEYKKEKNLSSIGSDAESSQLEAKLIEYFAQNVLSGLSEQSVKNASYKIVKHSYPKAKECIKEIADDSSKTFFISKAFEPVLEAYQKNLKENYDADVEIIGNKLLTYYHIIIGLDKENAILTGEDKAEELKKIISSYNSSIIFGDSYEDLGMFMLSDDILGKENTLKIAINPKSDELKENSDAVFKDWVSLEQIIRENSWKDKA